MVRMRSAVRIRPAAPKSIENFGFRCFFVVKTLKEVWVKMWVNRLTHTVTHTRKYAERAPERKFGFLSGVFIIFGFYITCAMKLLVVWAASFCFWRVARVWVRRVKHAS